MEKDYWIESLFDGVRFRFVGLNGEALTGSISATALAVMGDGESRLEAIYLENTDRIHDAARRKYVSGRGADLSSTDF